MRPRPRDALILSVALVLRAGLDLTRLLRDPGATVQLEDGYNAAAAWLTWHGGLWGELFALQYKEFCGGCTVVTALGAPVLGVFGDHLLVWRSLAEVWTLTTVALGYLVLRGVRREAAWAWAVFMALPPPALSALGLQLWGNHSEVQLLVWAAVLAWQRQRPLALGLLLGLGAWFCRTALFAWWLIPLAAWAWRDRRLGWLGLGLALGLLPLWIPASAGDDIGYSMGADLMLGGLHELPSRLALLGPSELSGRLFLSEAPWPGLLLLCAGLAGVGLALWRRQGLEIAGLPLAFGLGFVLSGFELGESHAQVIDARYWAPGGAMLLATAALGLGLAWERWRWPALALLLPLLAAAPNQSLVRGEPAIEHLPAADLVFFSSYATHRLSIGQLSASSSDEAKAEHLLRLLEGMARSRAGEAVVDPRLLEGAGLQVGAEPRPAEVWARMDLPEDPAFLRGLGLAQGVFDGTWPEHARARRLLRDCGTKRACLERELAAASQPDELAWAYGVFLGPRLPRRQLRGLAEGLGERGAALLEGVAHPLAGLDRPVGRDAPRDEPTHRPD